FSTSEWAMVRHRRKCPSPNVSWLYMRMRACSWRRIRVASPLGVPSAVQSHGQYGTSRSSPKSATTCLLPPSAIGIGGITQAVAQEIEREDDQNDRNHRQHQPWIERHHIDVLGFGQKHAPAGDRGS